MKFANLELGKVTLAACIFVCGLGIGVAMTNLYDPDKSLFSLDGKTLSSHDLPLPMQLRLFEEEKNIFRTKLNLIRQAANELSGTSVNDLLKTDGRLKLLLQAPEPPQVALDLDGFHATSDATAPVTIAVFSDYLCPACRHASTYIPSLRQQFGDRVNFVFVDFPINARTESIEVAKGAYCAAEQGKFDAYHAAAFNAYDRNEANPKHVASGLKDLDANAFDRCLTSDKAREHVQRGIRLGRSLGIAQTPTFFVNGRYFNENSENALARDIQFQIDNETNLALGFSNLSKSLFSSISSWSGPLALQRKNSRDEHGSGSAQR